MSAEWAVQGTRMLCWRCSGPQTASGSSARPQTAQCAHGTLPQGSRSVQPYSRGCPLATASVPLKQLEELQR